LNFFLKSFFILFNTLSISVLFIALKIVLRLDYNRIEKPCSIFLHQTFFTDCGVCGKVMNGKSYIKPIFSFLLRDLIRTIKCICIWHCDSCN